MGVMERGTQSGTTLAIIRAAVYIVQKEDVW